MLCGRRSRVGHNRWHPNIWRCRRPRRAGVKEPAVIILRSDHFPKVDRVGVGGAGLFCRRSRVGHNRCPQHLTESLSKIAQRCRSPTEMDFALRPMPRLIGLMSGGVAVCGAAVAELAESIVSPTPDGMIICNAQAL